MPLKDEKKRREYMRNYMINRYRNDKEFRERVKRFNREYQGRNREKVEAKKKIWRDKNPDYHRDYNRKYRIRFEFKGKCDWCLRLKDDCKSVQIVGQSGNKKMCRECRLSMRGHFVLVKDYN